MTTRRKTEAGPEPNLPVTPMLDMAFQLLAFFVMTYHPSDLEGQMDLSLPSEAVTKPKDPKDVKEAAPDPNTPIDLPANLTVIVRTQMDNAHNGEISDLSLQDEAGASPVGTTLDSLGAVLKEKHGTVENKDNIKLQADGKLKWEEVIKVMDECRKAGFTNVSFVPPPNFRMSGE